MSANHTVVLKDEHRHQLVVKRLFAAPRDLVWEGWTKPEHVMQWWGPKDWPVSFCTIDLRPGGAWRYCLTGPHREEQWVTAIYREIQAPKRLAYVSLFTDAQGIPNKNWSDAELVTVTFDAVRDKTEVTVLFQYASAVDLEAALAMGMIPGFTETLDNLEQFLNRIRLTNER